MINRRKERRTSRLSVVISAGLHAAVIGALVFVAAREGMLGNQLKKIAVTMVPKEKPPEKPKEKPPEPKPEVEKPRTEEPKAVELPPPIKTVSTPPPAVVITPAVAAPPAATLPALDFEGGKPVETTSDPGAIYKSFMEYTLRSHWTRPEGLADEHFVAEILVTVDSDGRITSTQWEKSSGDTMWDNSVKKALADTPSIGRTPPKGFPGTVTVRFDVQVASEVSFQ